MEFLVGTGQIDSGFRHQGRQTGNEIYRIEGHLCRSIPVRRLQGVEYLAGGTERQTRDSHRGAGDISAGTLSLVFLMAFAAHTRMQ